FQIQWLINLSRYMSTTAKLHFHSMAMMNEYCRNINHRSAKNESVDLQDIINSPHLEQPMKLDQVIVDEMVGSSWTLHELFTYLKDREPLAYSLVIGKAQHVLSKI
ncbi:hypothetical protein N8Z09_03920, partial [Methylophilaceae bacterium]|nr:hypothetical protein [Methylophilaceae bacterium]